MIKNKGTKPLGKYFKFPNQIPHVSYLLILIIKEDIYLSGYFTYSLILS